MDREMSDTIKGESVVLIEVGNLDRAFNQLRNDVKTYLSENYFGIESSDLRGRIKIMGKGYQQKLDIFRKHKKFLLEICGKDAPKERCDFDMCRKSVDYLVNVMNNLM